MRRIVLNFLRAAFVELFATIRRDILIHGLGEEIADTGSDLRAIPSHSSENGAVNSTKSTREIGIESKNTSLSTVRSV